MTIVYIASLNNKHVNPYRYLPSHILYTTKVKTVEFSTNYSV